MSKIAFLGLGQMGTPMATRLVHAGHRFSNGSTIGSGSMVSSSIALFEIDRGAEAFAFTFG